MIKKYIIYLIMLLVILGCTSKTPENEGKFKKVKENMATFCVTIETYKIDNGYYPKNSDVTCLLNELPLNFKNPYTGKSGIGEAYISGMPSSKGIIGYKSNAEGTKYVIYGYGVDWALITPETPGQFNKVPINIDWDVGF